MYFVEQVNAGHTFEGQTVKLMNDISMNGKAFRVTQPFAGIFDGGSHILTLGFDGVGYGLFKKVNGQIHHLGIIGTLSNTCSGTMSLTDTLAIGGLIYDCFTHGSSSSTLRGKSFMAKVNYGKIRNCYGYANFSDYYYSSGDTWKSLVEVNTQQENVENCYLVVGGYRGIYGVVYNYNGNGKSLHCFTDINNRNEATIDSLNTWVKSHPGFSTWSLTDYALSDFNPGNTCTVEFIDTLFRIETPTKVLNTGESVGILPEMNVDCTFLGWKKYGTFISDTDKVDGNWTLFAQWEQRILRQPSTSDMSVKVDDAAHASFQWLANCGEISYFSDRTLRTSRDESYSDTITFEATASQVLRFDYMVSSEENYDVFSAYVDGELQVRASGEKNGSIEYILPTDGQHTLVLSYSKDDEVSKGKDMAQVTNIRLCNADDVLQCTSNRLPALLVEKEGLYFCKISYSNTSTVLLTDSVYCVPGEVTDIEPNTLRATDQQVLAGKTVLFPIELTNEDEVKLCQFDLRLPDGVTVVTKSNGKLDAKLTERAESHSVSATRLGNGDYRFVVSSMEGDSFTGNSGALMEVSLDIAETMEAGQYAIKVLNAELSVSDGNDLIVVRPADTEATLTVKSYTPGDVNNDGSVSVTDVGCAINYILEQVPSVFVFEAADMNGDKSVSVTDVGMIINLILSDGAACRKEGNEVATNKDEFIGFQFDVKLAEGATIGDMKLASDSDHRLACRQLGNGLWRVVCYSPTNSSFATSITELLSFKSEDIVAVSNIRLTTADFEELRPSDLTFSPTGIASVKEGMRISVQGGILSITSDREAALRLYVLDGSVCRILNVRRGRNTFNGLRAGIYMINNQKVILR